MIPGSSLFDRYHGALLDMIHEEMDAAESQLIGGGPQDFASYRQQVGYVNALRKIEAQAVALHKQVTET